MAKRFIALVIFLVFAALVAGCDREPQKYMLSKDDAQKERAKQNTQLANPASMYCMNQSGNSLVMREDASGGQYGVCFFPDGSWCEEWAYYRGQCERGTNMTSCAGQFVTKAVCPPDYNPVCAKVRIGDDVTYRIVERDYSNACKACTSDEEGEDVLGYVIGECGG